MKSVSRFIEKRLRLKVNRDKSAVGRPWKNRRTHVAQLLKRGVTRAYPVTTGCARKGTWRMSKVKWVNIVLSDAHFSLHRFSLPWA